MQNKFVEVTPRSFNPMAIPGLSNKARDAVNAAFDAMSTWRNEVADSSEKNGKQVIEKIAAAAAALGWPAQVVDAGGRSNLSYPIRWPPRRLQCCLSSRLYLASVRLPAGQARTFRPHY